jgi:hypothetical protein
VTTPLSEEQLRILVAGAEGRLCFSVIRGRYSIDGEDPPDRKEREKLQKRGLLSRPSAGERVVTERGVEALLNASVAQAEPEQVGLPIDVGEGAVPSLAPTAECEGA